MTLHKKLSVTLELNPTLFFIGLYKPPSVETFHRPNTLLPPKYWLIHLLYIVLFPCVAIVIKWRQGDLSDEQDHRPDLMHNH